MSPGVVVAIFSLCTTAAVLAAQSSDPPRLRAKAVTDSIKIDGLLDDPIWASADPADTFLQTDPVEGAPPSDRTVVRVLTTAHAIIIGIECDDSEPSKIVSYSVRRDAPLNSEDHVRIVLGPFRDGRSGYVFAVNPTGARYDGLITPGSESDNPDWDGIWDAATARTASGWSAELWIPVQTLSFKPDLHEWDFNVQRRIQRRLEIDRWGFPARQYQITQTSRAGLLTDLPEFNLGLGLTVRPAVTTGGAFLNRQHRWMVSFNQVSTSVSVSAPTCSPPAQSIQILQKLTSIRAVRTSRDFRCSFPKSGRSFSNGMTSSALVWDLDRTFFRTSAAASVSSAIRKFRSSQAEKSMAGLARPTSAAL